MVSHRDMLEDLVRQSRHWHTLLRRARVWTTSADQHYQRDRYPQCLRWQHEIGHGLWARYPTGVQQQITAALRRGARGLMVEQKDKRVELDLDALEQRVDGAVQKIRCHLQSMFHYRTGPTDGDCGPTDGGCGPTDGGWALTSSVRDVPDWGAAFVVPVSGPAALAARDGAALALLCDLQVVDPSLWGPACKDPPRKTWGLPDGDRRQQFVDVLARWLSGTFDPSGRAGQDLFNARRRSVRGSTARRRPAAGGRQPSRFSDGLEHISRAPRDAFYPADYRSDAGALAFCVALPDNALGLVYRLHPLLAMCEDTVMKVHELRRQRVPLSPLHVVPVYVYTYELEGEPEQIYGAMNRAMRCHDAAGIAFWRPLIWQIDRALQQLPPHKGKLYRGINVRFNAEQYCTGQKVCWPALSSASAEKSVAESFVGGPAAEGSLFIIQCAWGRPISRFSKYPDEAEVLFRPNTVFTITSTLYAADDIGQFYSNVDNIAMAEVAAVPAPLKGHVSVPDGVAELSTAPLLDAGAQPRPDGDLVMVDLPPDHFLPFLSYLEAVPELVIGELQVAEAPGGRSEPGKVARALMVPSEGGPGGGRAVASKTFPGFSPAAIPTIRLDPVLPPHAPRRAAGSPGLLQAPLMPTRESSCNSTCDQYSDRSPDLHDVCLPFPSETRKNSVSTCDLKVGDQHLLMQGNKTPGMTPFPSQMARRADGGLPTHQPMESTGGKEEFDVVLNPTTQLTEYDDPFFPVEKVRIDFGEHAAGAPPFAMPIPV